MEALPDPKIAPDSLEVISSSNASEKSEAFAASPKIEPASETSLSDSSSQPDEKPTILAEQDLKLQLAEAFGENILAKACRSATRCLKDTTSFAGPRKVPVAFPETVPQSGETVGLYSYNDPDFWTCGFFPGELWALRERMVRYPQYVSIEASTASQGQNNIESNTLRRQYFLSNLTMHCDVWTEPLHAMADRTDTHDLGFIIMPALRREWELTSSPRALDSIIRAAHSLSTRYIPSAGVIRSWDLLLKKEITVTDMSQNALIIIDSLCNLDLLYYASAHSGDAELTRIATTHALSLMRTHLRPETVPVSLLAKDGYRGPLYSTCHVANVDPTNGDLKWRWTAQGYANDSTWSRGQAWAVLGYSQTFMWTMDPVFLEVACGVAEYFIYRLETAPAHVELSFVDEKTGATKTKGRFVPLWDFDAPVDEAGNPPARDSSAGMIASNGLLILAQALAARGDTSLSQRFLNAALRIIQDTLELSLAEETARFSGRLDGSGQPEVEDTHQGKTFDSVLKNGTANNNEHARRRLWDHGLVYGDYYLVECGNRLMQMGLI